MRRLSLSILCILACAFAQARIVPSNIFTDGMILQQQSKASVWGTATPKSSITVSASWGASATCRTDESGHWKAELKTPEASYKTYVVKISGDGSNITIKDVLIGEVWLASGQSNMEMPLRGFFNCPVENAAEYISAAPAREKIRMFYVPVKQSFEPLEQVDGRWLKADPDERKEMSATAYFFALKLNEVLNVPVGIVSLPYGGARVESWTPKEMLEEYGSEDLSEEAVTAMMHYLRPYMAYNAMLYPLRGYTVKGFIWYQGCSNVGKEDQFVERMCKMIDRWRADWNDSEAKLPFYTVEIAPYRYKGDQMQQAPALRQAQHDVTKVARNCEIVVTNDLVGSFEKDNIHPCKKKPVGDRLAYLALNRDYGFSNIACYSPEAVKAVKMAASSEIGVQLTNCENGLDRWMEIEGLEVAGSEGIFYPVTYAYFEWDQRVLRVRSEFVFDPKAVRYGWDDFKPGNLHNCEGLPVSPFYVTLEE